MRAHVERRHIASLVPYPIGVSVCRLLLSIVFACSSLAIRQAAHADNVYVEQGTETSGAGVMQVGETMLLRVNSIAHPTMPLAVTWKSSDTQTANLADLSKPGEGLIKALHPGHTTLIATDPANANNVIPPYEVWVFPAITWKLKSAPFVISEVQGQSALTIDLYGDPVSLTAMAAVGPEDTAAEVSFSEGGHTFQPRWTVTNAAIVKLTDAQGNDFPVRAPTGGPSITNALLKPLKAGTTQLEISAGAQKRLLTINVVVPRVTTTTPKITVPLGERTELTATVQDAQGGLLPDRGSRLVWKIIGGNEADQIATIEVDPMTNKSYLISKRAGTVTVSASYPHSDSAITETVTVVPRLAVAELDTPETLVVGQQVRLQLRLKDANGQVFRDETYRPVQLTYDNTIISARALADDATGRTLLVTALGAGTTTLTVHYSSDSGSNQAAVDRQVVVTVTVVEISGSDKVSVKLQVMDDQTAADAFGKSASQEFYIVQVALRNNVKPPRAQAAATTSVNGTGTAASSATSTSEDNSSILVFSDTLETRIRLLKFAKNGQPGLVGAGSGARGSTGKWTDVTVADLRQGGVNTQQGNYYVDIPLRRVVNAVSESNEVAPANVQKYKTLKFRIPLSQLTWELNSSDPTSAGALPDRVLDGVILDQDQRVIAGSVEIVPLDNGVSKTVSGFQARLLGKSTLKITLSTNNDQGQKVQYVGTLYVNVVDPASSRTALVPYRPYTYELVVNTFDVRNLRNPRSVIFNVLTGVGSFGSFLTSFMKFDRHGHDLAFLNSYNGLLLPALAKLVPDQTDAQRQNTVNMLMRRTEEVPSGQMMSRVLFYPKRPFAGYLSGYQTRISAIDTDYFTIEVAVISNRQRVGSDTPTPGNPQPASSAPLSGTAPGH